MKLYLLLILALGIATDVAAEDSKAKQKVTSKELKKESKCNKALKADKKNSVPKQKTQKNIRLINELSEKVRLQESNWINADKRYVYFCMQRKTIRDVVADYTTKFTNSVYNSDSNDKALIAVLNSQKNEINKHCQKISEMNGYIAHLSADIEKAQNDKINAENKLKALSTQLKSYYKHNAMNETDTNKNVVEKNRLYMDSIKYIVTKASSLEKLYDYIHSEVNNGNLKTLPKCKIENKYVSYPGELALSVDHPFSKPNYVSKKIFVRKAGYAFSPITGTIVFISRYKNYANVIGVTNSEKGVVLVAGLDEVYANIGDIVSIGQIIGTAAMPEFENSYSTIFIIARS